MKLVRSRLLAAAALALAPLVVGCPSGLEFIEGGTGDRATIGDVASVTVISPVSDLALTGGTPVQVNWRAIATTRFAALDVIFDKDQNPDNDNEITAQPNLTIDESVALLDTTDLDAGTYFIGVVLKEVGQTAAVGYAPGRLIVNQRPRLYFNEPPSEAEGLSVRSNYRFDRTQDINPSFFVSWTVSDPDSALNVQTLLDPDRVANGNEILLRESEFSTSGTFSESFTFDLPTASFEPGTYYILALVSDGVDSFDFYAPGSIQLRRRLAGFIDLRDLHLSRADSDVQGAVFEGFNPRDNAGSFVSSTRDIDNDGFDDFMILAQFAKPRFESNSERTGVGEAYLIYGRQTRFSGTINLNSTGTLFRGEIYEGPPEAEDPVRPSRGITSFAVLSDWDQDTIREFAFGMPFTDSLPLREGLLDGPGYFRTGAVVIAAGSSLRPDLGFPGGSILNLAAFGTLPHTAIQAIHAPEGFYGPKGAETQDDGGGATYFHQHLFDPPAVNRGGIRLGCRISTNGFGDQCGETVSAWAFDSIIISVPNRDPIVATQFNNTRGVSIPGAGVVSVYFCLVGTGFQPWWEDNAPGSADNYPGTRAPDEKMRLPHGGPYHYIIDDFDIYRIPGGGGTRTGSPGYVIDEDGDGFLDGFHGRSPIPDRTTRIWGTTPGGRLGGAIGINDFNADGLQDILVGNPLSNDGAGACFIVLGRLRDLIMGGELPLEELGLPLDAPTNQGARIFDGIRVVGSPGARLGQSQAGAGDFNNDGIADVIIGSPLVNNRQGGVAVFFGSREVINLTQEEIPFDELPQRGLGVIFEGEREGDLAGARVAGVGDIDRDGNDDILIAAPNRSVQLDIDLDGTIEVDRTNCGVVYLVYGSPDHAGKRLSLADVGTEALPGAVFIGRNSADFLGAGLGEQGDRTFGIATAGDVDGDGFNDLLLSSVSASPRDRTKAGEVYLLYGTGEPE